MKKVPTYKYLFAKTKISLPTRFMTWFGHNLGSFDLLDNSPLIFKFSSDTDGWEPKILNCISLGQKDLKKLSNSNKMQ